MRGVKRLNESIERLHVDVNESSQVKNNVKFDLVEYDLALIHARGVSEIQAQVKCFAPIQLSGNPGSRPCAFDFMIWSLGIDLSLLEVLFRIDA